MDAHCLIFLLFRTNLIGIVASLQNRARLSAVKPYGFCRFDQNVTAARGLALAMISLQQCLFKLYLFAFDTGPMHQAVCIEGAIDPATRAEGETNIRAALPEIVLRLGHLLRSAPVFPADMFDKVFTLLTHLRIQFEGMHDQFGVDSIAKSRQCKLQRG